MNMVKPVAFALVSANIVNAVGNWILIYGKWGAPAMGAVGSGWSTAIARLYMASVLVGYLLWYDRKHRTELLRTPVDIDLLRIRASLPWVARCHFNSPRERRLCVRHGAHRPARRCSACQPPDCSEHRCVYVYGAARHRFRRAVRVGQAIGRRDPRAAGDAGGTAIFLGAAFMTGASAALLLFPRWIARMYTPDETVIRSTILCSLQVPPFSCSTVSRP